jgi:hypothetical protein
MTSHVDHASRTENHMPTFPRGYINYQTNQENQRLLNQLDRQETVNVATQNATVRFTYTAADYLTLRGIPAVGEGVQGAIPGTRPDTRTDRAA